MRINLPYLLFIGFAISLSVSCDTDRNIEPPEDSYFLKYYGHEGDQTGVDMIVNSDNTFFLFGTTKLPGKATQLYLVKADARGMVMWEKTYGGLYDDEEARDIEPTSSGGIVMVANIKTVLGDRDIMIMTLDTTGIVIDSSGYSLPGNLDEFANSVSETLNGSFIVSGYTSNVTSKPKPPSQADNDRRDALHVRFFNDLQVYPNSWSHVDGGPGTFDEGIRTIETTADVFYFFGLSNERTLSINNNDFWIVQLGQNGDATGRLIVPGVLTNDETSRSMARGNGFVMIGSSVDASGDSSMYLVKFRNSINFNSTAAGNIEYAKPLSSSGNLSGISIYSSSQFSGYIVLGNERDGNANGDIFLSRVGNNLDQELSPVRIGGVCEDQAGAVIELSDGRIMIIGTIRTGDDCESKMALIKVNRDGKFAK